jgi:hypothetical protein
VNGSLLSIAEETVTEFVAKATGTAIDWIQLPGMKVCASLLALSAQRKILMLISGTKVYGK